MQARSLIDGMKYIAVEIKEARKALSRRVHLSQFRGDTVECPLCRTGLRRFRPVWKSYQRKMREYGADYPFDRLETFNAEGYSCPSCDASDRDRLYLIYIQKKLAAWPAGKRLRFVDFAPSRPLEQRLRRMPGLDYRTADLFRADVDERVDISDMPAYADGSVDGFICSHVLEHVIDDRKAMSELARILSPDGFGIVMVPLIRGVENTHEDPSIIEGPARWKAFGQDDHLRQYGRHDFLERLRAAGLRVDTLDEGYFGADVFHRAGISPSSVLYAVSRA